MASHAIFQYNVLTIDDTHNTWTNVIVKMTILRLLGSSDDKEKRGIARPEGPPLRGFRCLSIGASDACVTILTHEQPTWFDKCVESYTRLPFMVHGLHEVCISYVYHEHKL